MKNTNLHSAKAAKNDEFYTMYNDIEREVQNYLPHFEGKVVYLNCDSINSNFWNFFRNNFDFLKLKKVIATHYEEGKNSYKLEMDGVDSITQTELDYDGDFRHPSSVELLKNSDIVVTNPPFSLFREFVELLEDHEKQYLVVGNQNAITYKEIFPLIQYNRMWLGVNLAKEFITPEGDIQKFGNIGWFTNLYHGRRNEVLEFYREYRDGEYYKYNNWDAIEVDRVAEIPVGYKGEMGVPISFLNKYNPNQFEIVQFRKGYDDKDLNYDVTMADGSIRVKTPYFRIIIKAK